MGRSLALLILLGLLSHSVPAVAEHEDVVHAAAHIGLSYLIDDALGMFFQRALHMDRVHAEIFSGVSTLFIGAVYKASENASGSDMLRATGLNAIGVGTHAILHLTFHF